jgi:hypothetical protein
MANRLDYQTVRGPPRPPLQGQDLAQAVACAQDILKREGMITLITRHKAKGLE